MKQRLGSILIFVYVIGLLSCGVSAARATYTLEELEVEITAPEGEFYILLRSMDEADPTLKKIGMTAEELDQVLEESNLYFDALAQDGSYELSVQMLTGEDYETVFDYALIDQNIWDEIIVESKSELEKQGLTVSQIERYESGTVPYLYVEFTKEDDHSWLCQYQTVHDGKMISINAISPYLEEPVQEIRDQLKAMADSLHFTYDAPVPQEVLDAYEAESLGWKEIFKRAAVAAVIGGLGGGLGGGLMLLTQKIKT